MFPLPLIAYEYARRFVESQAAVKTSASLPPEENEALRNALALQAQVLQAVIGPLPVVARPMARWFADVVEANREFSQMLKNDPVGTLEDFARFLFDGGDDGRPASVDKCLPYLLFEPMTFPPLFYFGAASFLATPDSFLGRCEDSRADIERLGETAVEILLGAAMPAIGFGGIKALGRAAQAVRKEVQPQEEDDSFLRGAAEVLVGPLGSVIF